MPVIICICKFTLFLYLLYSLKRLTFDNKYKFLKILYIVVCIEEILRIMHSQFDFIYDLPTKCNIFLGILVLCTISEVVEERKILYFVYIFVVGYNIYYHYIFARHINVYGIVTITILEGMKYIVKMVSIVLINYALIKKYKKV